MLNYLWCGMILLAIVTAAFTGNLPEITTAALDSAREAVTLCITILGVLSMWTGLMKIAERAGLINQLSDKMKPMLRYLFPSVPRNHPSFKYIATNFIANILGLGWAATPAGLKAMQAMQSLNPKKDTATPAMRMFMVINMSSLQLITVSIIAYRMQYNSVNPSEIIGPGILVTSVSTVVAVVFCKVVERFESL
ncbi:MAG: nucleoside recognition protein [Defluviitaleaceae bacterium]|nr:nucleoside recognition protein [Defluviitaleaceae bacterium]